MLDLDNAKELYINGKEVKKLMIGNRVIWEKIDFESILLTTNKNILSASDNERALLTAQLVDEDNNPVAISGKTINFDKVLFEHDTSISMTQNNSTVFYIEDYMVGDKVVKFDLAGEWSSQSEIYFLRNLGTFSGDYVKFSEIDFNGGLLTLEKDETNHQVKIYVNGVLKLRKTLGYYDWNQIGIFTPDSGNECLSFGVYDRISTSVTDSNGQCSVYYNAEDAGNINIKARSTNVYSNNIQIEDIMKYYGLTGTEQITTISTYTPSISDNTLTNGCGYLNDGFDNTGDWELSFDYNMNGASGALIVPDETNRRDYFFVQLWGNGSCFRNPNSNVGGFVESNILDDVWYHIKITKRNTLLTIYLNGVQINQADINTINNYSTLHVGLDKSLSSSISKIRNIKVKSL